MSASLWILASIKAVCTSEIKSKNSNYTKWRMKCQQNRFISIGGRDEVSRMHNKLHYCGDFFNRMATVLTGARYIVVNNRHAYNIYNNGLTSDTAANSANKRARLV